MVVLVEGRQAQARPRQRPAVRVPREHGAGTDGEAGLARQSAVHRHLTREDRQALKEAQKMQYADWRAARYAAIYLNAAVRNAPEVRERMTKAERDAEREREQHLETVLAVIGRGGAVTNGSVSPSREAEILMDPRTPVSELIKIRARQQAG